MGAWQLLLLVRAVAGSQQLGRLLAASLLYSVHFCSSFNTCRLAVVPCRVVSWQPDLSTKEALRGRQQKPQGKSERERGGRWQVAEERVERGLTGMAKGCQIMLSIHFGACSLNGD